MEAMPAEAMTAPAASAPPEKAQAKSSTTPADRVQELQAQLAAAEAAAAEAAGEDVVMVKVEPPHSELRYGGAVLTGTYTPVPRRLLGALTTAASDSNATITTQES
jgi:hypothetical protein